MVAVMYTTILITSAMRCHCSNSRLLHVGQTMLIVRSAGAFRRHQQPTRSS